MAFASILFTCLNLSIEGVLCLCSMAGTHPVIKMQYMHHYSIELFVPSGYSKHEYTLFIKVKIFYNCKQISHITDRHA